MAEYFKGTLLASPIVRGSSGDTYGTHHSVLGIGGYMEVDTLAKRNSLPIDDVNKIGYDGISSGQRRIGMLVYVHEEDTIYQLKIDKTTWDGLDVNGKLNALADNSNWVVFVGGDSTGENITQEFTQTNHQFNVGDVIGHNGTNFLKVSNTTAKNIEPLGVVSKVIDLNSFVLNYSGYIDTSSITDSSGASLSGGTVYYLSNIVGKITSTKPTDLNAVSKPILVVMQSGKGIVLQYRGIDLSNADGVDWQTFTGYTAQTQSFLDTTITGGTNLGYFEGKTGVQTLPLTDLRVSNKYSGDYKSVYNNYYRDSNGIITIGVPPDGIPRRGYVNEDSTTYSFIWSEYTGDTNGQIGWIPVDGDIRSSNFYGGYYQNYLLTEYLPLYTNSTWNETQSYNNGSNIVIGAVEGNTLTGDTYVEGGPVYSDIVDNNVQLRTIISETPDKIKITYDDYFINLSGSSFVSNADNIGGENEIYAGNSGDTLHFRTIKGAGDTTISTDGDVITVTTNVTPGGSGSGENITKFITQTNHGFSIGNVLGVENGIYTRAIANGNYSGETIGIVTKVIDSDNFELTQSGYVTGFTSLQISETYYVSTSNAGEMVITKPTTIGQLVRPILAPETSTTGWVLPYEGYIITSGGSSGSGNEYYTGKTPSTIDLGGISSGTVLTGKTYTQLFQELLVPTINPVLSNPSNSFTDNAASLYEIGCSIPSITFTSSFNRGSITLDGSFQNYRAGLPNTHCFSGTDLTTIVPSTNLSESQTINNYMVLQGIQTWGACVAYDQGPQPLDSNGDPYSTPLPSGTTSAKTQRFEGVYPIFATCTTITTLDKIPLISMTSGNNIVIDLVADSGGNKQKFEIATDWLTSRSLKGVNQYNTVAQAWQYPGGSQSASLNIWDVSDVTETIQGNVTNYKRYTYNSTDRGGVKIRLEF